MSANKAALLGNTTERKIIEHDRALKGLKIKQYVSSEAIDWRLYYADASNDYTIAAITLGPGEIHYGSLGGYLGVDRKLGMVFPFWNFNVDVDNDPDYRWFNGSQVHTHNRRKVTYGWKYDQNDFNGVYKGEDFRGKIPLTYWLKNEDTVAHTYFIKIIDMTSFEVETFGA